MQVRMILAAALALPLLVATAAADLYVEQHSVQKAHFGDKNETFEISFKNWYSARGHRNEETSKVQHSVSIFRWDTQTHWVIDLRKNTYREETLDDLKRTNDEAKKKNEAFFEDMIKQEEAKNGKEAADKMRKGFLGKKEYKMESGETEKVLGHACTRFRLLDGSDGENLYWVTREIDPGEWGLKGQLDLLNHFDPAEAFALRSFQGVVLKHQLGKESDPIFQVNEATKVSTDAIDPTLFDLPKGLTREDPKAPPEKK